MPKSLVTFLIALAIVDDLGAVAVIALFYTDNLNLAALAYAGVCTLFLVAEPGRHPQATALRDRGRSAVGRDVDERRPLHHRRDHSGFRDPDSPQV
ncbi:MAG: Na+/H+ antiporter NhaA [Haliea sp.]|nr:Na+/H+ antiporter NhaA [Haliea sp.]